MLTRDRYVDTLENAPQMHGKTPVWKQVQGNEVHMAKDSDVPQAGLGRVERSQVR